MRISAIQTSSMEFEYACRTQDSGDIVAEGSVTHVAVDAASGEPTRVPDDFRDAVVNYQDAPPDPV